MNALDLYLSVRAKEGRLYTDEVAARLPSISPAHPLAREWQARADSCLRLKHYLARTGRHLTILELGCGNGWLSGQLASLPNAQVWGLDLDSPELAQAARLFSTSNLGFLAADIFSAPFPRPAFDVIVLASVIQYFPDLAALLHAMQPLLNPGGEIHLLDSPLYEPGELPAARQRTRTYYTALGFPGMAEFYFHHAFPDLQGYALHWLYRPRQLHIRLARGLGKVVSPFPWVCLRG